MLPLLQEEGVTMLLQLLLLMTEKQIGCLRFQQRLPQRLQQRLLLPKPHHHHQRRSLSSSSTGTGRSQGSTTTSSTMARTTTAQWSETLIQGVKFPDAWLSP